MYLGEDQPELGYCKDEGRTCIRISIGSSLMSSLRFSFCSAMALCSGVMARTRSGASIFGLEMSSTCMAVALSSLPFRPYDWCANSCSSIARLSWGKNSSSEKDNDDAMCEMSEKVDER